MLAMIIKKRIVLLLVIAKHRRQSSPLQSCPVICPEAKVGAINAKMQTAAKIRANIFTLFVFTFITKTSFPNFVSDTLSNTNNIITLAKAFVNTKLPIFCRAMIRYAFYVGLMFLKPYCHDRIPVAFLTLCDRE